MRTLRDETVIWASPDAVWDWLASMADRYTDWHPDHVSARWIRGEPNRVGSRLEAVEELVGHRERLVFEMTAVDPPHRLEYRIVGLHALLIPGGRFRVTERGHVSVFAAEIDIRFTRLAERLLSRRLEALRTHMRQEGESAKGLIEGSVGRSPPGRRKVQSPLDI